jgi:transposase
VRPQADHEALQAQRQVEQTPEFRHRYALRSGIEATLSQAVRGMGIRRSRYDGLARTHVQHILTAVAINLVRIDAVLTGQTRGKTRRSHFTQLAASSAFPVQMGA